MTNSPKIDRDARRYSIGWLTANERIQSCPEAALWIAGQYRYGGRRTAVCAAEFNTPFWQMAVARAASLRPSVSA